MPVLVLLNYVQLCPQQYHNTSFSTSTMWAIAVCPGFSLTNNNEFHQENLKPSWFSVQSVQSRAITAVSGAALKPSSKMACSVGACKLKCFISSLKQLIFHGNQIFVGIHGRLFHFLSLPQCGSDRKWKRRPWMPTKIWFDSTHLQTERTRGLQCPASAGCSSSSSWSWRNLRLKVLITMGSFCVKCVLSFWNTKVRCWTMFTRHFAHGVVWKVWENRVPQEITLILPKKSHSFFPKYFLRA